MLGAASVRGALWRRVVLLLLLAGLLAIVALYLWYVRGVGIRPQVIAAPDYVWELRGPLPHPRTEVTAAALAGLVYVIGGIDGFARTTNTVQIYDPSRDRWALGPPLPRAVHHAMAATVGGRLFVVGGFSGVRFRPSARVFAFDGTTWVEVAPLPEAVGAASIAVLGGRIHVVGGQGERGDVAAHYIYDPEGNRWSRGAALPQARDHLAAAALGGRLYAVGGRLGGQFSRNVGTVEVYDPAEDRWRAGPPLAKARSGHAAEAFGRRLYVFGGEEPGGTIGPVEEFDGARWRTVTRLPTPRHGLGSALLDGVIYVLSGGKRPAFSVSGVNEALVVRP